MKIYMWGTGVLSVTVLACVAVLCLAIPAQAATTSVESITMSPTSKRYQLKTGQTKTDEFTIINDGKVAYDFEVYAQPYFVKGESYQPDYAAKRPTSDANRWVSFDKKRYHLEPGESTVVLFTVTVADDAAPGGHYGVLFAETQSTGASTTGNSVVRKKRVGSIIYATVSDGYYRNAGEVLSQSTSLLQFNAPLESAVRIKNTGNTDFIGRTTVEVASLFGGIKNVDKKDYVVLPDTTRLVPFEWTDASWFGLYKVTIATSFLQTNNNTTHYVLMAPLWAYLLLAVAMLGAVMYWVQARK